MAKGQSFLVPDKNIQGDTFHLHVIISNPDDDDNVLAVPVCTYSDKPWQDTSCLLPAGCHPFVNKRSYISYQNAKEMSLVKIFNGIQKGLLIRKDDFDMRFVQDMQKGAESSMSLPNKFSRFFKLFV